MRHSQTLERQPQDLQDVMPRHQETTCMSLMEKDFSREFAQ